MGRCWRGVDPSLLWAGPSRADSRPLSMLRLGESPITPPFAGEAFSLRLHSQISSTTARMHKLKQILRRRAAHNGLELSGPAKLVSTQNRPEVGSAAASC